MSDVSFLCLIFCRRAEIGQPAASSTRFRLQSSHEHVPRQSRLRPGPQAIPDLWWMNAFTTTCAKSCQRKVSETCPVALSAVGVFTLLRICSDPHQGPTRVAG